MMPSTNMAASQEWQAMQAPIMFGEASVAQVPWQWHIPTSEQGCNMQAWMGSVPDYVVTNEQHLQPQHMGVVQMIPCPAMSRGCPSTAAVCHPTATSDPTFAPGVASLANPSMHPAFATTGHEHWQPISQVHPTSHNRGHILVLVSCPADPSLALSPPQPQQPAWNQGAPCEPASFAEPLPVGPRLVPTLPLVSEPFNLHLHEQLSDDNAALTLPESGLCTPEITPRYTPARPRVAGSVHVERVISCALINNATTIEKESSVDELSELDDQFDEVYTILHDSKSYASSEASTAISRSARRRRGRRSAKAGKASSVIVEAPRPGDISVTEDKKRELIQQLEEGGCGMDKALATIRGSVLRMSMEPFGCRVVQSALDVASSTVKEELLDELRGCVLLALSSPHANFVVQKVIEVFPVSSTNFVAEELATFAAEVARHRFGCRVLSRLVEHHLCSTSASPATNSLVDELLFGADHLIRHNFARHVLELILEHGSAENKHSLAEIIRTNIFDYSKHRSASYVVEKAFAFCCAGDTVAMSRELLADPERFLMLAGHECGVHVVKAATRSDNDYALKGKALLLVDEDRVRSSKYGKRLLDEM